MKPLFIIILFFVLTQSQAQQDSIARLHKPYQAAMGLLNQLQNTMPKDSVAIVREWQRLSKNYKQVSDSLQQHANAPSAIYVEMQRLIDRVNYAIDDARLQKNLNALYNYGAEYQEELVKNDAPFKKIAQCLMGVKPEDVTHETRIIEHNAEVVQDFYKRLDTKNWSDDSHQRFITFFAAQYINIGSVSKTEKFYRHFDTLFAKTSTYKTIRQFNLPDTLNYHNGVLDNTNKNWSALPKEKIILCPDEQSLFDFVYLVSTLRSSHRGYADKYDVIILRKPDVITDQYLKAVKSNLAFDDYYIATLTDDTIDSFDQLPVVLIVNKKDEVTYQAGQINTLFKKLNAPLEAAKKQSEKKRLLDLAQRKAERKQRAIQTIDSTSYKEAYKNITFVLKGLWQEDLNTQLIPVRRSETDTVPPSKPYLAEFRVKHPKYQVYQLPVLVTGKKQHITITANDRSQKQVTYKKEQNARFYEAIQTIDETIAKEANYDYILESYPFKQSSFLKTVKDKRAKAANRRRKAIEKLKKQKIKEILKQYTAQKKEQTMRMM